MQQILRLLPLVGVFALAGCASMGSSSTQFAQGSTLPQPNAALQTTPLTPAPAEQVASAQAMIDVSTFIDPAAVGLLSAKERVEASGAQFNALEFGRPGAPRAWQGDTGASGQVTVGPDLAVNNLRCRNFTHAVTISGKTYTLKGQACREPAAGWMVTNSTIG